MGRRGPLVAGVVLIVMSLVLAVALVARDGGDGDGGGGDLATATAPVTDPADADGPAVDPQAPPTHDVAPSTTGPAEPNPAPTTTIPGLRRFTVAATGDFLIHGAVSDQARTYGGGEIYDFSPMLAEVAPLLSSADLAMCHLEGPLSVDNTDISGYPMFSAPHELATAIAGAGYDTCSTASNHSLDRGLAGLSATLDHLDAAGVAHAGTARSAEEAASPTMLEAGGVTVAHLAYTYGLNGFPLPSEAPWAVHLLDAERIVADAAGARAAGAEFVVVSMHAGNEYQQTPSADQVAVADRVLGAPEVDLVIGHHVHVIQPVERRHGKVVAYGLGNFLSNQSPDAGLLASTQDGVILQVTVEEHTAGAFATTDVRFTPTFVDRGGGYVVRPVDPVGNPASYQRTLEAIGALGAAGVTPDR